MLKQVRGTEGYTRTDEYTREVALTLSSINLAPRVLGPCVGGGSMLPLATDPSGAPELPYGTLRAVQEMLRQLSQREGQVVRLRYGIGTRAHSIDEISERLGVLPHQVERIELRAFRKLRETSVVGDMIEPPATGRQPFRGDHRPPAPPVEPRRLPDDPEREANPWDEV